MEIGKNYIIIYDDGGDIPLEKSGCVLAEDNNLVLVRLKHNQKEEWINKRYMIRAKEDR